MDPKATTRKYAAPGIKVMVGLGMLMGIEIPEGESQGLLEALVNLTGSGAVVWGMLQAIYRRGMLKFGAPE